MTEHSGIQFVNGNEHVFRTKLSIGSVARILGDSDIEEAFFSELIRHMNKELNSRLDQSKSHTGIVTFCSPGDKNIYSRLIESENAVEIRFYADLGEFSKD